MVSIRLSDSEFRKLHEACATTGARSVSDLARAAMQKLMSGEDDAEPAGVDMRERLEDLDVQLTQLRQEIQRLSLMVEVSE